MQMKHEFVRYMPENVQDGVLYVSIDFGTVIHNCCCGCGTEVITPLSPIDWKLTFDGETISLHPSIGNWEFPCRSHYWIREDRVKWAEQWSKKKIHDGRAHDVRAKKGYYKKVTQTDILNVESSTANKKRKWWRLFDFIFRKKPKN